MASVITAGTASNTALNLTGDTSGELQLKTNNGSTTALTLTTGGNINIPTAGARITGDFSNATVANRVAFQTTTVNSATNIHAIPNGTSTNSGFKAESDPAMANGAFAAFDLVGGSDMRISSATRGSGTALPMTFHTGGSERLRIDTSGNVGIGVVPSAWQSGVSVLQVGSKGGFWQGTAGGLNFSNNVFNNTSGVSTYITTNAAASYNQSSAGDHIWSNASSGTAGTTITMSERMRIDSSGNVGIGTSSPFAKLSVTTTNGNLGFTGGNTSGGSKIQAFGATSSSDGYLAIEGYTKEYMRITSDGALMVNQTALPAAGNRFVVNNTTWGNAVGVIQKTATVSGTGFYLTFQTNGGDTGSINTDGTNTTYSTTSDYRLKENVAPMTGALEKVAQLKPVTYSWKTTGKAGQGFIAHELQEVVPDCVTGEKDAVNEDGSIKPQGIDTSFLVATLTAAIQELKAELDVAKAEIQALKGAK